MVICSVFCGFIFSLLAARTTLTRVTTASSPALSIQGSMRSAPVKQKTLRYLAGSSGSTSLKFQHRRPIVTSYISDFEKYKKYLKIIQDLFAQVTHHYYHNYEKPYLRLLTSLNTQLNQTIQGLT